MQLLRRILPLCLMFATVRILAAESGPMLPEDVFPQLRQVLAELSSQSSRMLARNLDLAAADGELQQAKSGLYPSVSGYYRPTWGNEKRKDIPGQSLSTDKVFYSVNLTQPLYHWGEKMNSAKIGEIRRLIATENHTEAYRLLTQEVRTAYLQMIARKVQMENARFSRVMADSARTVAEERMRKGEISEGAVFQPRVNADQAALNQETAEWEFTVAKQNFATLTGGKEPMDTGIPDEIPMLAHSANMVQAELARFLSQGEPNTPQARASRHEIAASQLLYKNSRTRLLPKLSFVAAVTQDEQSYSLNVAQRYGLQHQYIGLQVTWTIFDGLASQGATASSHARWRQAQLNYKQLSETLARDAQRSARAVDLAQRQMVISDRLFNSAKVYLDYRQEDLKRGQVSEAEVNTAQASFNAARNAANASRYTYLLQVAAFMNLISEDPVAAWR